MQWYDDDDFPDYILLIAAAMLISLMWFTGCSSWVHNVEDPVLSGARWVWDRPPTTQGCYE